MHPAVKSRNRWNRYELLDDVSKENLWKTLAGWGVSIIFSGTAKNKQKMKELFPGWPHLELCVRSGVPFVRKVLKILGDVQLWSHTARGFTTHFLIYSCNSLVWWLLLSSFHKCRNWGIIRLSICLKSYSDH